MKTELTLIFIITLLFASACKKIKEDVKPPKPIYVSYIKSGQKIEFKYPQSGLIWTKPCTWGYVNLQNPSKTVSLSLLDTTRTGTFNLRRNQINYASVVIGEPNSQYYILREGTVIISKCDTMNFIFEGTFEGKFISQNMSDSFDVSEGEFYFEKPN